MDRYRVFGTRPQRTVMEKYKLDDIAYLVKYSFEALATPGFLGSVLYQSFLSRALMTHRTAGEGETIFYSTLPLPPAHDLSATFCMLDDYQIFLIASLVFTRLLLDEIYHLIELTILID